MGLIWWVRATRDAAASTFNSNHSLTSLQQAQSLLFLTHTEVWCVLCKCFIILLLNAAVKVAFQSVAYMLQYQH